MWRSVVWGLSVGLALSGLPQWVNAQGQAAGPVAGPARLVEKVVAQPGEAVIPYEKYVLPNGLTLLVSEDHSDPLVRVELTFHVGSARETVGKSGFAHLFEHVLLFEGTAHVAPGQGVKILSAAGSKDPNGTTNTDRTTYYETLPANQLETGLWLAADQLGFSLNAAAPASFARQQAAVRNERGMRTGEPYGRAEEVLMANLYPYGHPYSWPTIGFGPDIDHYTPAELTRFFRRWYGPNNATLAIVGDVQPAAVVQLVEKYFGPIAPGPAVVRQPVQPARLAQTRYVSYADAGIRQPLLWLTYPGVPKLHPDALALDALADLLTTGQGSILHQALVAPHRAAEVGAGHQAHELGGEFIIEVRNLPGTRLRPTAAQLQTALAAFAQRGVSAAAVAGYRAQREAQLLARLAGVAGKATTLLTYEYLSGQPNQLPTELQRLRALTKEDVMRVFRQYVLGQPAVVLSVVPPGRPDLRAAPDNYWPGPAGYQPPADEYAGLPPTAPPTPTTFDRRQPPAPGPPPMVPVPPLWRATFANGLRVLGTQNTELPLTELRLVLRGADRLLPAPAQQAGLAALTAALLGEGTAHYTSPKMAAALAQLGSTVDFAATHNETVVTVCCLTKNLAPTLALVAQSLLHPRFAADDFARIKQRQQQDLASMALDGGDIAKRVLDRVLFGATAAEGWPVAGSAATLARLTRVDVQQYYARCYTPRLAYLAVVSDAPEATIVPQLAFLRAWTAAPGPRPAAHAPALPLANAPGPRLYFVATPGAAQTQIRLGYVARPYDATGPFYLATVLNDPLGWGDGNRLTRRLREELRYTYSVWSRFSGSAYSGRFTAYTSVRTDATAPAVRELVQTIAAYRAQGMTPTELVFTQASLSQQEDLNYETGAEKADYLVRLLEYGLPADYVQQQAARLRTLTADSLNRLAHATFPPEQLAIVVVGDEKHLPALRQLGYPVALLDTEGRALPATDKPAAGYPGVRPAKNSKPL